LPQKRQQEYILETNANKQNTAIHSHAETAFR